MSYDLKVPKKGVAQTLRPHPHKQTHALEAVTRLLGTNCVMGGAQEGEGEGSFPKFVS